MPNSFYKGHSPLSLRDSVSTWGTGRQRSGNQATGQKTSLGSVSTRQTPADRGPALARLAAWISQQNRVRRGDRRRTRLTGERSHRWLAKPWKASEGVQSNQCILFIREATPEEGCVWGSVLNTKSSSLLATPWTRQPELMFWAVMSACPVIPNGGSLC